MSIKSHLFRHGVLSLFVLGSFSAITHAQNVNSIKTLQWEFRSANIARVRGGYSLTAKAYSGGTHGRNKGWRTARPKRRATWLVNAVNGLPVVTSTITNNAETHAIGTGTSSVSALRAVVISNQGERPPRYRVTTTTSAGGSDVLGAAHQDGWQRARHRAKAIVKVSNAKVKGWALTATINGVTVGTRTGRGRPNGTINEGGRSFHDPIIVTVTETATGESWSQELFSFDLIAQNGAGTPVFWEYDTSRGVMLAAEPNADGIIDGTISMNGSSSSEWLVDSFGDFGATITDGTFDATGAWADLPWDLTMMGFDVVMAELAPEYMPTVFDYVVPSDLLNPESVYSQSLAWDDIDEGDVFQGSVPAPGPVALLIVAGLTGRTRQRR